MAKKKKKKKRSGKSNKVALFLLFVATFFITLFIISNMLATFSPPVDVNIGNSEIIENTAMEDEAEDYEDLEHADVDSRLKWIQYEDNMTSEEKEAERKAKKLIKPEEQSVNKQAIKEIRRASKRVRQSDIPAPPVPRTIYNLSDTDVMVAPAMPSVKEPQMHWTPPEVGNGH